MALHAVILAGGSGTRFWPLSRAHKPKQFLALVEERSLLAATQARVLALCPEERTWVVCGAGHVEEVRAALPGLPPRHLVVEPAARNTGPAIGLAAVHALAEDPDATLCVLPSDHHVARPDLFCAALARASMACQAGMLVALGIKPTRPETGFGYLRRGGARPALGPEVYDVDAFVEKPDAATAARYVADPAYAWNAGIFVFRADAILAALGEHLPRVREALGAIAAALSRSPGEAEAVSRAEFPRMPSISIDYGVMEPASRTPGRIAFVPADFGWSDVGSFAALPEVRPLDARGNAVAGDALCVDCDDSVVLAQGGRLVAAVGLKGICVIDAGDALLVVPRERSQDVRAVVEALRASGRLDRL